MPTVVEELGDDSPAQMRAAQHAEVDEFLCLSVRLAFHVVTLLNLWQAGEHEHDGYHDEQGGQDEVGELHGVGLHLDIAFPTARIVYR